MAEHERPDRQEPGRDDPVLELLRRAGPRPVVPPEREARVRQAVHAQWRRNVAARRRRVVLWVAGPLAAAALVVLAIRLPRAVGPGPVVAAVEVSRGDVRCGAADAPGVCEAGLSVRRGWAGVTGGDGRVALRLAGGASLRLDAGSRIVFLAADRLRLERGAAYLDTGGERRGQGALVETAFGAVRDIGTQLEVRVLGDDLRVRVREGEARVERGATIRAVGAGQALTWRRDGSTQVAALAPDDASWTWVQEVAPTFRLDGSTAAAFLQWVAREGGLELRWAAPELATAAAGMVLHGELAEVSPLEAPALVLPTCGLRHHVTGGQLVVERAGS